MEGLLFLCYEVGFKSGDTTEIDWGKFRQERHFTTRNAYVPHLTFFTQRIECPIYNLHLSRGCQVLHRQLVPSVSWCCTSAQPIRNMRDSNSFIFTHVLLFLVEKWIDSRECA